MKLKLSLLLFCLMGIGIFSHAQNKPKTPKPTIVTESEDIPVIVKSHKKANKLKPPPPPPVMRKDGKPLAPPKVEAVKFTPPKIVKDAEKPIPPPPPPARPAKTKSEKPVQPDAPPPADLRAY